MIGWIARGLTKGIVTTRYPSTPEPAPAGFHGTIDVLNADQAGGDLQALCPTGAITVPGGRVVLDRGRCILCGLCVRSAPDRFAFAPASETAVRRRESLVVGAETPDLAELRPALAARAGALRRSIHIRHVDAGSDGSEEWEIHALSNPYYDIHRLGIYFTAAPRHADILLVTGGGTEAMREPLLRAWEAMPEPKAVVAAGTEACSGALGLGDGIDSLLPVDVFIPGSPPTPIMLLHGILLATGVIANGDQSP